MAPSRRRQGPAHHRGPAPLPLLALLLLACGDDPPTTPDPVAATIEILSGDAQRAVQGLPLEDRVAVRVLDDANRPLSGAAITFTPSSGGQADSASVATDDGGRATAIWILGPDPGEQALTVSSGAASARVTAESLDLEAELDLLFVPATQAEMDVVLADWAGRSAPAEDVRVELSEDFSLGGSDANLRVVSHVVTGYRHYGVIITPAGAEDGSLPILVYLHGGESGVSTADAQIAALGLGEDLRESFVYVLPSYRSEPLRHGETQWVSEGTSSHWDYDVDDVIALVNVAFETTPEAKPGGYNLLGGSRGGGVALLAGIRDERVERIVSFFGPTDFFDTWVREIVREAALRTPRRLTGVPTWTPRSFSPTSAATCRAPRRAWNSSAAHPSSSRPTFPPFRSTTAPSTLSSPYRKPSRSSARWRRWGAGRPTSRPTSTSREGTTSCRWKRRFRARSRSCPRRWGSGIRQKPVRKHPPQPVALVDRHAAAPTGAPPARFPAASRGRSANGRDTGRTSRPGPTARADRRPPSG